jgi:predicted extracellular nuclease
LKPFFSVFVVVLAFLAYPVQYQPQAVYLSICKIQGSGFSSFYQGLVVRTEGYVTADFDQSGQRGFYIQSPGCDSKSSTSDGIFVYLGERIDLVMSGDRVSVKGMVQEYYGMTEIQAAAVDVVVFSHDNLIPAALELNPPFENSQARAYFESIEAMRVELIDGRVVGPTDSNDRTWLVRVDLQIQHVFHDDLPGNGEVICADDGGLFEISPEASTGDTIQNLIGVLDFRLGSYCIQLTESPQVNPENYHSEVTASNSYTENPIFSVSTFNLEELFDTIDDPLTEDQVLSQTEYQRRLHKRAVVIAEELKHPALLAVQEAENVDVLEDLVEQPEIQVDYSILLEPGLDVRGLDVALMYRPDQVDIISVQSYQGCTGLIDGFEPDGNGDPKNPQNSLTCDQDGDGTLDGNRLFTRTPLMVHLLGRPALENKPQGVDAVREIFYEFWIVVCHLKSKVGDTSTIAYTLPRRTEQAQFIADLVREIRLINPYAAILVLGDFNDHPDSQPLAIIKNQGLMSTAALVEHDSRYTYIYEGISQTLDDILFNPQVSLLAEGSWIAHVNADYPVAMAGQYATPNRSSDHDPLTVMFTPGFPAAYLPLIVR